MKTSSHHSRSVAVLVALALASSATASVLATAAESKSRTICSDSRTVTKVEQRPSLPNGRGTPNIVKVTKRVCTSCAAPATAAKPALPNGRGALVASASRGLHECGDCR